LTTALVRESTRTFDTWVLYWKKNLKNDNRVGFGTWKAIDELSAYVSKNCDNMLEELKTYIN